MLGFISPGQYESVILLPHPAKARRAGRRVGRGLASRAHGASLSVLLASIECTLGLLALRQERDRGRGITTPEEGVAGAISLVGPLARVRAYNERAWKHSYVSTYVVRENTRLIQRGYATGGCYWHECDAGRAQQEVCQRLWVSVSVYQE